MRVRLTYSVELEDVPYSVADLIEDETNMLDSVQDQLEIVMESLRKPGPHLGLVSKEIDAIRQSLSTLDTRLSECESILAGYERAMAPPSQPSVHSPRPHRKTVSFNPPPHLNRSTLTDFLSCV